MLGMIGPSAPLNPARPPLRGSPKRRTDLMESLEEAYLRAVAASAGCVIVGRPDIDEGVEIMLSHTADSHQYDHVVYLNIQMKSTSAFEGRNTTSVSAGISGKRWNQFCTPNPTTSKIIVIMSVPRDQANWTEAGHEALTIRYCAYWVNIEGQPPVEEDSTTTVTAPKTQIFNDIALCAMMERIGQGGKP